MALNVLATGIEFTPQGGSSVNLLDDYEEGTWTPGIVSGTMTKTQQSAFYTKIGRSATVSSYWEGGNNGDSTGLTISGLPFTSLAGSGFWTGVFNYAVGNTNVGDATLRISGGVTTIYVSKNPQVQVTQAEVDQNHFIFSITYFT